MALREWRVAELADISEPGALEFNVGEGEWPYRGVVVRWQGEVHAYANICPHKGHPLNIKPDSFFTPDCRQLICVSHGAMFDPATGICGSGPCEGAQMTQLDCRVDGGTVWVRAPSSLLEV